MEETKYGKYFISEPKIEKAAYHSMKAVTGVTYPDEVFLDATIIPDAKIAVDIGWRWEVPNPDPVEWEHIHDFDEVLCFIGADPKEPRELGAEIEFHMGGEVHTFTKSTTIFVPKGVSHCPFYHKRVDKPFILIAISLADKYPSAEEDRKINPENYIEE